LLLASCTVALEDDSQTLVAAVLNHLDSDLVFNAGNRRVSEELKIDIAIRNQTGHDLDLKFVPTCGCTTVDSADASVKDGDTFRFSPRIRLPADPQKFSVSVKCEDKYLGKEFALRLNVNVVAPYEVEPNVVLLDAKSSSEIELKLEERFPDFPLAKISCVNEGTYELLSNVDRRVVVKRLNMPEDLMETKPIYLVVESNDGSEWFLRVPVEVRGLVKMSPSLIALRKSSSTYNATLLLIGVPDTNGKIEIALASDSKENIPGKIVKMIRRGKDGLVVFAEFPSTEVDGVFTTNADRKTIRVFSTESNRSCQSIGYLPKQ
jgi:hypothetical protein